MPTPTPLATPTPSPPSPPPAPRTRPPNLHQNPKSIRPYNISSFHTSVSALDTEPAMAEEYSALTRNCTWTLVPRVPGTNVVDYKWLYKLKCAPTGDIQRYKTRLVAKGSRQQPGIDYHNTFSPVVKATTIRLMLSLAVTQKSHLRQLDIQNAYLHGGLTETVYSRQPRGFVDPDAPDHVFHLHKSLYGRLSMALLVLGFTGSKTDPSLFIYNSRGTLLYILVYVDDIILIGNNPEAIEHMVHTLGQQFPVQDMGRLSYFLGIEIVYQGPDIILSQQKYILDILQRAGLSEAKPVSSPIAPNSNLFLGDSAPFENSVKYRQVVGALQYVTLSRPDITFAVNKVCQFMHSPTDNHWSTVKRILRYLKGTVTHGLLIRQQSTTVLHAYADATHSHLSTFSDADWAGCPDDRRSTGGYAIYLGSNLVSWSARKQ